jgi:hypothetical protein
LEFAIVNPNQYRSPNTQSRTLFVANLIEEESVAWVLLSMITGEFTIQGFIHHQFVCGVISNVAESAPHQIGNPLL